MAKTVSIVQQGGTVEIVVAGGDVNQTRNFPIGSLYLQIYDGGQSLSLLKVATDEAVESFIYSECIEPAGTGSIGNLRIALARLVGNPIGALSGDTSGSVLSKLQTIMEDVASIMDNQVSILASKNKFVLEDNPPAGSWTSDAFSSQGMRCCSLVGEINSSGATTGTFRWEGSNDETYWVPLTTVVEAAGVATSPVGDTSALLVSYTGAASFQLVRLVFTSTGKVQIVAGTICVVK